MKTIKLYITEKLHINKDFNINSLYYLLSIYDDIWGECLNINAMDWIYNDKYVDSIKYNKNQKDTFYIFANSGDGVEEDDEYKINEKDIPDEILEKLINYLEAIIDKYYEKTNRRRFRKTSYK